MIIYTPCHRNDFASVVGKWSFWWCSKSLSHEPKNVQNTRSSIYPVKGSHVGDSCRLAKQPTIYFVSG